VSAPSLLTNSRQNLLAFSATIGAHLVIVPVVISEIGLLAFGRAGLVMAAWAPLTVIGTVIGQAATREIAARSAAAPDAGALQLAALLLCGAAAAAAAAAFCAVGPFLLQALDATGSAATWRTDVLVLAPGWAAQQFLLVFQGLAAARQDFRLVARVSIVAAIVALVGTLGWTLWMPSATGYLVGVSTGFVAAAVAAAWMLRSHSGLPGDRAGELGAAVRALLGFGRWQFVAQLAGTLGNQIDRYVLASLAAPDVIGQFNAANRLQEAAYVGVVKAAEVLFPRFGANARASNDERKSLYLISSWAVMAFSGFILGPIVTLAEPLMRLWAGADVAQGGALLLQTLTIGGLIGCGSSVFSYYLMGMGQNGPLAAMSVVYSLLTIVLSIATLRVFGPAAAGVGLALASVARVGIALGWCKVKAFPGATWAQLVPATVLPLGTSSLLAWLLSRALPVERITEWWQLVLAFVVVSMVIALVVTLVTASSSFGRSVLRLVLQRSCLDSEIHP
jgi:O-antigen/teichoic acid export membrane protein